MIMIDYGHRNLRCVIKLASMAETGFFLFYVLVFKIFCAVGALCMFSYF